MIKKRIYSCIFYIHYTAIRYRELCGTLPRRIIERADQIENIKDREEESLAKAKNHMDFLNNNNAFERRTIGHRDTLHIY